MKEISINSLYIKSTDEGPGQSGVFARKLFNSGETVLYLDGLILNRPTRTSIQVSEEKHIEDKIGAFINHNCNPTCKIEGYKVVAIDDIGIDDQITFDYSKNETIMASPFVCACCNKLISGSLVN
jgi:hypothetical protein